MKILIIKSSALGDIIHAFPALEYLHEKFPEGEIDWVVEAPFSELLKGHPAINRLHLLHTKKWRKAFFKKETWGEMSAFRRELRKKEYDVVFDLQGNLKSSWVLCQARAKKKVGFGWKSVPEWPNALFTNVKFNRSESGNIREDYLEVVRGFFSDKGRVVGKQTLLSITNSEAAQLKDILAPVSQSPVLIALGARWENKRLGKKTLQAFLENIYKAFPIYFLFAWGSEEEKKECHEFSKNFPNSLVLDRLSLSLLQQLMASSALVVAMDSLPLHLCGLTQTSSISFFGPSSSQKYAPVGEQHLVLRGACPYGVQFTSRCPKLRSCSTGACLKQLEGDKLFQEAKEHIEKTLSSYT